MESELFKDLLQSLTEAGAIAKGQAKPSRQFNVQTNIARAAREQTGLSQSEFARMLRVSVKTLQNWEQHRRTPTGPAAALLTIVRQSPETALKALHQ
ncbi:helix-turn-helix domain-containing protein [Vandammella animalimorsus]|uniref:Helix-turn-helix domain-containing protein n=1 Tax=Vandammella animalimorsus TaxID=2029117 RepID=A0A3M6QWC3_9BURK|nr:NadS family protein [Vandammella animalimorsus]RMX07318.1 helix-turn-helix domain-containing protein [Vandammella animalimorsus]